MIPVFRDMSVDGSASGSERILLDENPQRRRVVGFDIDIEAGIKDMNDLLDKLVKLKVDEELPDLVERLNSVYGFAKRTLQDNVSTSTASTSALTSSAPSSSVSKEIHFGDPDDASKQYTYDNSDVNELGRGAFGKVFKCFRCSDVDKSEPFAVKVALDVRSFNEDLIKEVNAMNDFDHPNIIHFSDSFASYGNYFYSVMELVEGCELQKCGCYSEVDAKPIIMQLFKGLCYLHHERNPPFMHRDIKPANIMVLNKPDPRTGALVKLIDFGLTKRLESRAPMTPLMGTPVYMAPEVSVSDSYNTPADCYSLGGTIYFMLTGSHPKDDGASLDDLLMVTHLHLHHGKKVRKKHIKL